MAYSQDDITSISERISAALQARRVNAWQAKFLADMGARVGKYGPSVRFSSKQVQKLQEIIGPLPKGSHTAPSYDYEQRYPATPRRRSKPSVREGRWLANRFVRHFAFAAAIIGGIFVFNAVSNSSLSDAPSLVAASPPNSSTQLMRNPNFTVTDGDTIRVSGESRGTRLVGFNAPEIGNARCSNERELGHKATSRLRQLASSGEVTLQKVTCSCRPGTEGTDACNYGRSCGILRVNGRDVGEILVSEGLAVSFRCGATSCPRTPRPWCG